MTTYSLSTYVTAYELARHTAPDGALLPLIQSLSQELQIFGDVHFEECNDGTGHIGVTEYYQPVGTWRGYNEGVAAEAPISADFREPTCMIDSRFHADRAMLFDKAGGDMGKAAALRARMLSQFIVGHLKTISTAMLYGTRSDGKSPRGIMKRSDYNSLSSSYVHDNAGGAASGTANKTSLLVIGHGALKYHWIYPKGFAVNRNIVNQPGSPIQGVGLRVEPLNDDWVTDVGGSDKYMAVRNHVSGRVGHAVEDARYIQRICNISTTNIDGVDDFSIDEDAIIDAINALPDDQNAVIYGNKTARAQVLKRVKDKGNVWHMANDPFAIGKLRECPFFDTVPFHVWEGITNSEATVT